MTLNNIFSVVKCILHNVVSLPPRYLMLKMTTFHRLRIGQPLNSLNFGWKLVNSQRTPEISKLSLCVINHYSGVHLELTHLF